MASAPIQRHICIDWPLKAAEASSFSCVHRTRKWEEKRKVSRAQKEAIKVESFFLLPPSLLSTSTSSYVFPRVNLEMKRKKKPASELQKRISKVFHIQEYTE